MLFRSIWSHTYTNNSLLGRYRLRYYANLTDGTSDALETTAYYNVERLEINFTLNSTQFTKDTIQIPATAYLYNGTAALPSQNLEVSFYFDSALNRTANTTSSGSLTYNYTHPTGIIGPRTLTLNATDANGIFAENNAAFTAYAKTFVNYTYTISYTPNSSMTITSYLYRNDTGAAINGTHNITERKSVV